MTCDSELDCIEDNSGNNKGGDRQTRGQRPFFTLTGLNNVLLFSKWDEYLDCIQFSESISQILRQSHHLTQGQKRFRICESIFDSDYTGKFAFWCTLQWQKLICAKRSVSGCCCYCWPPWPWCQQPLAATNAPGDLPTGAPTSPRYDHFCSFFSTIPNPQVEKYMWLICP